MRKFFHNAQSLQENNARSGSIQHVINVDDANCYFFFRIASPFLEVVEEVLSKKEDEDEEEDEEMLSSDEEEKNYENFCRLSSGKLFFL